MNSQMDKGRIHGANSRRKPDARLDAGVMARAPLIALAAKVRTDQRDTTGSFGSWKFRALVILARTMRPTPIRFLPVLLLLAVVRPPVASAIEDETFYTFNQSPLIQIYGLPAIGSAVVLEPGRRRFQLAYEVANTLIVETRGSEMMLLDGESRRMTLRLGYSPRPDIELGVELPYVSYSGGFLDSFIESWHDAFGLPNGDRDKFRQDQLTYYYRRGPDVLLDLATPVSGPGDVRLTGARQLARNADGTNLALRASLKLPTGEPDELRGSGATDLAVWFVSGCGRNRCPGDFGWQAGAGVLWLGKGEVLPDQQNRLVAVGSTALEWRALPSIALKAQLNAHTPFYGQSDLTPLEDPSLQVVLGGTWRFSPRAALDLGVTEDLLVHTAPDVSFLVALRTHF